MQKFEFNNSGRIVFGRGQIERLTDLGPVKYSNVLLIHAGSEESWAVRRVVEILRNKEITVQCRRQSGEPTIEEIDAGIPQNERTEYHWVIGLGGGSALDAAKATAALLRNGGWALDYMEIVGKGKKLSYPANWIAVPTTAGTGAEATRNAVLTSREKKVKASMRSELLLPPLAIIDAEL